MNMVMNYGRKFLALRMGAYSGQDNGTKTYSNRAAMQHSTTVVVRANNRRPGATGVLNICV